MTIVMGPKIKHTIRFKFKPEMGKKYLHEIALSIGCVIYLFVLQHFLALFGTSFHFVHTNTQRHTDLL